MTFDIDKHLIKVQGGRQYLPVAARLVWFREQHPDWGVETRPITIDTEKQFAIFEAFIYNTEGRLMSKGTKMENVRGFPDYIEKAETGAIGRDLAVCGFGTQFAPEIEEGNGRNAQRHEPIPHWPQANNPTTEETRLIAECSSAGNNLSPDHIEIVKKARRDMSITDHRLLRGEKLRAYHQIVTSLQKPETPETSAPTDQSPAEPDEDDPFAGVMYCPCGVVIGELRLEQCERESIDPPTCADCAAEEHEQAGQQGLGMDVPEKPEVAATGPDAFHDGPTARSRARR